MERAHASDAEIVGQLEQLHAALEQAVSARDLTPERFGVLNSLRLMLEQSARAARLLLSEPAARQSA